MRSAEVKEKTAPPPGRGPFSLPQFSREFGPQLLVQFTDVLGDILQYFTLIYTRRDLAELPLIGAHSVEQVGAWVLALIIACSCLSIGLDVSEHTAARGIDEELPRESKQHLVGMRRVKLWHVVRQIPLLIIEDGMSLVFSGCLVFLEEKRLFNVFGFNFSLTLLGFFYMLMKHLADTLMSQEILRRPQSNKADPVSSGCCCLGFQGQGTRVSPEGGAEGTEMERLIGGDETRRSALGTERDGGADLEGGPAQSRDHSRRGLDEESGNVGEDVDGDEDGEESSLERRQEARVVREAGCCFRALLYVADGLHECVNETTDVLQVPALLHGLQSFFSFSGWEKGKSIRAPASSPPPRSRCCRPLCWAPPRGGGSGFLSSLSAGTAAWVVMAVSVYCLVGSLAAARCIRDIRWMMRASTVADRCGSGWGRAVVYLQCLTALPFSPVLLLAFVMNRKVFYEWWDRQKTSPTGGREGEAFLSNVRFCFFLLEDIPSVVFNLLIALGESSSFLSVQGANLLATVAGLLVRVAESEGQRRVRTDEAVALGGGGGVLKVTKANIQALTASLWGTGSTHIQKVEIKFDPNREKDETQFPEGVLEGFFTALVSRKRPSLKTIELIRLTNHPTVVGEFFSSVPSSEARKFPSLEKIQFSWAQVGDGGGEGPSRGFERGGVPFCAHPGCAWERDHLGGG
uniref:Uncharacterized protein n=1 Tax=Chromera velia CCMP2878 TaxID=1169474 RepID=A0A0G4I7P9_9ALVE|eukprot:Cvel_11716.t1-p1 / transcript=Cvel_11716.t1 / gene=Cvel_11716 / organism=Chromera_velia_CCMP2878 / gene_product=hypothetical protein / transcript_product=hypothetical protein / location=Cvel_scaffold743:40072-42504(-) / protein_length=686 / sequence_SO=supercontig / SO=protein_coding / is_pseudo=false